MGEIRLKVPRLRQKRSGYYWQPTPAIRALGFAPEALGKDVAAATARAEHLNRLVDAERRDAPDAHKQVENVANLIAHYRQSDRYDGLAPSTRPVYESILRKIERATGHYMVAGITRRDLVVVRDKVRQVRGRKRANAHLKLWRVLLEEAMNLGWRQDNPATGLGGADHVARHRIWTPAEVDAFCAKASAIGRASMALAVRMARDSAQRQGDVIRLRWSDWDGVAFTLRQGKTGMRLRVPALPGLAQMIAEAPMVALTILVNEETGRPYNSTTFRHVFRSVREAARLPADLQFRDLRRTALTELGEAGATDDEIRAVSGHRNRNIVATYVVPSDRMAAAAQAKRAKVGK